MRIRQLSVAACAVALMASSAGAQSPAQRVETPRLRGENFVFLRYTSPGSAAAYAATRLGPAMFVAGATLNTVTDARSAMIGAGTRLRFARGAGVSLIIAGAKAAEGYQAQLYAMPRFVRRPVSLGATVVLTEPLDGLSRRKLSISPATAGLRLTRWLQVGGSTVHEYTHGKPTRFGAGPMAQVRMPIGSVTVENLGFSESKRRETRVSFSAAR